MITGRINPSASPQSIEKIPILSRAASTDKLSGRFTDFQQELIINTVSMYPVRVEHLRLMREHLGYRATIQGLMEYNTILNINGPLELWFSAARDRRDSDARTYESRLRVWDEHIEPLVGQEEALQEVFSMVDLGSVSLQRSVKIYEGDSQSVAKSIAKTFYENGPTLLIFGTATPTEPTLQKQSRG